MILSSITYEDYFSLRTDIIRYYGGKNDERCMRELGQFFLYCVKHQLKPLSELWNEYKVMAGFTEVENNPDYHINAKIRDMEMQGFYFGSHGGFGYDENRDPLGFLIDQPILIDFNAPSHREFFFKLFPYRFIHVKSTERLDFLAFHLNNTFKNDVINYRLFLHEVKASSRHIIGDYFDLLKQWIEDALVNNEISRDILTTRQQALIYYLKIEAGDETMPVPKMKGLINYGNSINGGSGGVSFKNAFVNVENQFREKEVPASDITLVLKHLKGKTKLLAQTKIGELGKVGLPNKQ